MKLRKPSSGFYRWWNSYTGRRIVSATYSLGAAIVIMGAMFKILHLPVGNIMLGIGMSVESFIFALGIFDKPYREYDWSRIFNFKAEDDERIDAKSIASAVQGGVQTAFMYPTGEPADGEMQQVYGGEGQPQIVGGGTIIVQGGSGGVAGVSEDIQVSGGGGAINFGEALTEEDVIRLSDGIKNLTLTAENLQKLADVALQANGLAKNIETASEMAAGFAETQQKLNATAETLASSYQNVNSEIDQVVNSTRSYSGKVENVNQSLSSINAIYEIQLRHIQAQTENLQQQVEAIRRATENVDGVSANMDVMKEAAHVAQQESQRYQNATRRLSKQVEDLNAIYGNMLNALS
ncbi:MAG TPA: gliding motility protein GldL [Bacteroidales bacterium]|nr:gliding motility protein GldL [Bacteroidales bacterium]